MLINHLTRPWFREFMREGEGAGGAGTSLFTPGEGGGDDKGGAGDDKGGEGWTGPDFIAEKYRAAENPLEEQAKGYSEAMGLVTRKRDEIRGEIEGDLRDTITAELKAAADADNGVPEAYEYPEGFEAPGEETDKAFKDWAKANGVSQEAFGELAKMYGESLPDLSGERVKLGDNAEARIAAMNAWGSKNIPESLHGAAEDVMKTAAGLELVEHFMNAGRDSGYSPPGGTPPQPLTRDQIMAKQNDPRYHQIGKIDPAFQAEVTRDWERFAKANPR